MQQNDLFASAVHETGLIAGVDEAGRGPLAGPVCAAAVILDPRRPIDGIDDSKRLTARRREQLFERIQSDALAWHIAWASAGEIDRLNILQATFLAMRRALEGLNPRPERALIDGNRVPGGLDIPAHPIVGGDALEPCIGAASILAKVARDRHMQTLHAHYPQYGFAQHSGYPTAAHLDALRQHGPCPEHRRSFGPVKRQLIG
ncbi:MAG: ribonuclease HII [Halothiobacillaceae bacterium]|nr:ribonuclease HII [Halothiobacillaceae bacterium]